MIGLILGPTAVGKTTITNELLKRGFKTVISTTTRLMREGETNHVDYHFVTEEEFVDGIEKNLFAEHDANFGKRYGIYKSEFEGKDGDIAVVVNYGGAVQLKETYPELKIFSLYTEDINILKARLSTRGNTQDLDERMDSVFKEIEKNNTIADYRINTDGELQEIVSKIHNIFLEEDALKIYKM